MWSHPGSHTPLSLHSQYPVQYAPYIFQQFGYPPTFPIPHAPQVPMSGYFQYNFPPNCAPLGFTVPHVYNSHLQRTMSPTIPQHLIAYEHTPQSTFAKYDDEFLFDTLDATDVYFDDNLPLDHSFFTNRLSQLHVDTTLPSVTISPDKCEMLSSNQSTISISPSLPDDSSILSVCQQTTTSLDATISEKLDDYRIILSIIIKSFRNGDLESVPHVHSILSNSAQFERLNQPGRYDEAIYDDVTIFAFDGLLYNSLTKEWYLGPLHENHHWTVAKYAIKLHSDAMQASLAELQALLPP